MKILTNMTSKILMAHDGSEMSDKAFRRAVDLATAFKSEVILLHVIEHVPVPSTLILGNDSTLIKRARRNITREMERGWNKLVEIKNHKIEGINLKMSDYLLVGSPSEQILNFAKKNKVDMIVMASRRFKGISKIKALGSVTRKVSELADCPVLIVH